MIQNHQNWLDDEQLRDVEVVIGYIACFYAKIFLQAIMASKAHYSDLFAMTASEGINSI